MKSTSRRPVAFAAVTLLALAIAGSGVAAAQTQVTPEMKAQAKALARACRADFRRLCPGVKRGGGRILACLQDHNSELSSQCRDAMSKASETGALPQ